MNETMTTSGRLAAMLALVEEKKQQQQNQILSQAQEQAATIIAMAHRQARARMKEAITLERRRMEQALHARQAQLETEMRNQAMNVAQRQLQQGRGLLDEALLARWQAPESRTAWITGLAQRALACLPTGQWEAWHPIDLPIAELEPLEAVARQAGLPPPVLHEDPILVAGLRIRCQGAWVDGTAEGLVANRMAIDALLLARLQPEGASK